MPSIRLWTVENRAGQWLCVGDNLMKCAVPCFSKKHAEATCRVLQEVDGAYSDQEIV